MYIDLPNGADYRRVEVTEDGRIGIVYTEQCVNNGKSIKDPLATAIPKPVNLICGTDVYQKDNGTNYWYCKIKGGRDEFMHLYFGDLAEEDILYDENGKPREFSTDKQRKFRDDALKAVKNKPKRGFVWIPVYWPSEDAKANINLQYVSEKPLLVGLDEHQWEELFENYSPENGSQMASKTTVFLLKVRLLKDKIATIVQLAETNLRENNYHWDSDKGRFKNISRSKFGGVYGFGKHTCTIVKDSESSSGFSRLYVKPDTNQYTALGELSISKIPERIRKGYVGLLELTK